VADLSRRAFLSEAGIAGAALSTTAMVGCAATSPSQSIVADIPFVDVPVGSWVYDAVTRVLALNLGELDFAGCSLPGGSVNIKLRALLHDMMYWRVIADEEVDGATEQRILTQQWVRTSTPNTGIDPSMEGVWTHSSGYELTLNSDGTATATYSGGNCQDHGFLGGDALPSNVFRQGVAAGDPSADGAIIWTRAENPAASMAVSYQVATDPQFFGVVRSGNVAVSAALDYTSKTTLTGLDPATIYYYRFTSLGANDSSGNRHMSSIGRFKTAPVGSPDNLKFGVASCSSYPHGYFNGYRQMTRHDDLDCVFHLGDYIYDYPGEYDGEDLNKGDATNSHDYGDQAVIEGGRVYKHDNQTETVTLEDYRRRFQNYREDADLQMLHSRYAFINTWDDHETANDSYDPDLGGPEGGAENHGDGAVDGRDEGDWEPRKRAAAQAYNEWLPITDVRDGIATYENPELHRAFTYGDLMELVIIDTRVAGRHHIADVNTDSYTDASRKLMSDKQRDFLTARFTDAQTGDTPRTWKVLGQQIMMAHLGGPPLLGTPDQPPADDTWLSVVNPDQWDGYDGEREAIFNLVGDEAAVGSTGIENFVVLTGDIHTSWAIDLVDDPRKRAIPSRAVGPSPIPTSQRFGVEFVTPSITSPGLPDPGGSLSSGLTTNNPHMKYVDLENRGYSIMEVTPAAITNTWFHLNSITDVEDETQSIARAYRVLVGTRTLVDVTPA
jgi:alkaline phosphatase D